MNTANGHQEHGVPNFPRLPSLGVLGVGRVIVWKDMLAANDSYHDDDNDDHSIYRTA